jgi:cytochrome P450
VLTGYDEIVAVYRDRETFSSCNSFGGPFPGLPEQPVGDDASELIERYRDVFPSHESLITFDDPRHADHRGLMMGLLTPRRLKENEEYMRRLSDELIDKFVGAGKCDFISEYAQPFALLVIADLLGIPESDHAELRRLRLAKPVGKLDQKPQGYHLDTLEDFFSVYMEDRRREPLDDVLGKVARATFADGRLPEIIDIVRVGTFLFAGGQSTAAQFLGNAVRVLAEDHELQGRLREDRARIPAFLEEALRLHSSVKVNFRMARYSTEIAGVPIPAGSTVVILLGAANRDERRFQCPVDFDIDRPNLREQVAFGRGAHSCAGAPLARAETVITVGRLLDRLEHIELSSADHGPPGDRHYDYIPSYVSRGLQSLHISFTPRDQ